MSILHTVCTATSKLNKRVASRLVRAAIVATTIATFAATAAQASVIVTLWQATTGGVLITDPTQQALPTNPLAGGTALATFTYNGDLNWFAGDQSSNYLDTFVGFGGGTVSGCVGTACADANTLNHILLSTSNFNLTALFRIAFSTSGPESGSIDHDDGISVFDASDTTMFLNSSAPTSLDTDLYNLATAGNYHLWYVEANGAPSILDVHTNDRDVPEPTALLLVATTLLGLLGFVMMRRRADA